MNFIFKLFVKMNIIMFRMTNGRLGSSMKGVPILLLTTTGNKSGQPRTVPVMQIEDGGKRYVIGSMGGAPEDPAWIKNIQKTPQVALLVDHYNEDWTRLWYVLVRGEAELVSAPAERKRAIQCLRAKYPQYSPEMLEDDAPLLRITPQRITAWGNI